jgi:hypothetical protein
MTLVPMSGGNNLKGQKCVEYRLIYYMHFKSLGDHLTTMFTVFLLIEYATLSFEAYFSLGVYILTGQISWFTFSSFLYLISYKKSQCKKFK